RDALGRDPGRVVQDDREARLPDGADPPPFREARLARADRRDPLLDRVGDPRPRRALVAEAALMDDFSGQRVCVLGLGRSGRSAAASPAARGARVVAVDERPAAAIEGLADLPDAVERRAGAPFPPLADFDLVVPSPGVPAARWSAARRALGDVEL